VVILRRAEGQYEGLTGDYLPAYLATDTSLPVRLNAELHLREETLFAVPQFD
jgi:hypothetical protein